MRLKNIILVLSTIVALTLVASVRSQNLGNNGMVPTVSTIPNPYLSYTACGSGACWYLQQALSISANGTNGNASIAECYPGYISQTVHITALGLRILTAGSSDVTIAVYTPTISTADRWVPGTLVINTPNIVNTSSATFVSGNVTSTMLPGPAWYFWCHNEGDGTAVEQGVSSSAIVMSGQIGTPTGNDVIGATASQFTSLSVSLTYTGCPSSCVPNWPANVAALSWADNLSPAALIAFQVSSVP